MYASSAEAAVRARPSGSSDTVCALLRRPRSSARSTLPPCAPACCARGSAVPSARLPPRSERAALPGLFEKGRRRSADAASASGTPLEFAAVGDEIGLPRLCGGAGVGARAAGALSSSCSGRIAPCVPSEPTPRVPPKVRARSSLTWSSAARCSSQPLSSRATSSLSLTASDWRNSTEAISNAIAASRWIVNARPCSCARRNASSWFASTWMPTCATSTENCGHDSFDSSNSSWRGMFIGDDARPIIILGGCRVTSLSPGKGDVVASLDFEAVGGELAREGDFAAGDFAFAANTRFARDPESADPIGSSLIEFDMTNSAGEPSKALKELLREREGKDEFDDLRSPHIPAEVCVVAMREFKARAFARPSSTLVAKRGTAGAFVTRLPRSA
mmetsp:Transcript_35032/g.87356  ORF Transcript_35032/g.87356 Transcript_35032/m.87356 type:complete len:389 (+) Transcript_35032:473-1639(+)